MTSNKPGLRHPLGLSVAAILGCALISGCSTGPQLGATAATVADLQSLAFQGPVRVTADNEDIQVLAPGYAHPAWQDLTGDGRPDLIVSQYKDGKMGIYEQTGDGTFSWHGWIQADGEDAVVPGIW